MLRAVNRGTHTGEGIETSLSGLLESPGGKWFWFVNPMSILLLVI